MKKTIKITANTMRALSDIRWFQRKLDEAVNDCHRAYIRYPDIAFRNIDRHTGNEYSAILKWSYAKKDLDDAQTAFDTAPEIVLLSEAIKAAEGRATARTITAADVVKYLDELTSDLGIPKKAMEGISAIVDINGQHFPRAYKYTPESTHFSAEYKSGSWRVTDVYRFECDARKHELHLTDAAKDAIIDRITVRKA